MAIPMLPAVRSEKKRPARLIASGAGWICIIQMDARSTASPVPIGECSGIRPSAESSIQWNPAFGGIRRSAESSLQGNPAFSGIQPSAESGIQWNPAFSGIRRSTGSSHRATVRTASARSPGRAVRSSGHHYISASVFPPGTGTSGATLGTGATLGAGVSLGAEEDLLAGR